MPFSPFAQAIRGLLLETDLFTREEWCQYLAIDRSNPAELKTLDSRITDWCEDRDVPDPRHMELIVDTLRGCSDPKGVIRVALERFWQVMRLKPSQLTPLISLIRSKCQEVSPLGGRTAWQASYLKPSAMRGIEGGLSMVDPSRLDDFIQATFAFWQEREDLKQPIAGDS